jgi:predicted AAA+ superfamily ATPase
MPPEIQRAALPAFIDRLREPRRVLQVVAWAAYVRDALIETTISKDVLLMTPVQKPELLRRVFDLACRYSGQMLSYQKMMGQLADAGNTTTLAHYLELLEGAGMV